MQLNKGKSQIIHKHFNSQFCRCYLLFKCEVVIILLISSRVLISQFSHKYYLIRTNFGTYALPFVPMVYFLSIILLQW